ncbi:hypothetical protein, partial [Serratia marcescens]
MKGNDALDADIYFGNEVLFDIPIDIDIPKNGFGEILVRINSDNKELHKMAGHGSFTFLVKRYTIDHNLVGTIKSEGVRIYNRTFNTTGIKNTIIIEGRADHLLYKNFRGVVDSNSHVVGDFMSENVDELTFYLSNSSIVLPRIRPHVDFHGNVKIDKSQFKEFITPCGKEIKFEKYYKYKEHDGTIELHPYQVAIIKSISGEPVSLGGEKSTFIDVIESTLQLVSFVEGRRVAWSSWEYKCKDMMVKYLRGNVLSSTEETYSVDDAII